MKTPQYYILLPFSTIEEFNKNQEELFKRIVLENRQSQPIAVKPQTYLTRKETAAILKISLTTLNELTKDGTLKAYRLKGRVLYKQEEIDKALVQMKFQSE